METFQKIIIFTYLNIMETDLFSKTEMAGTENDEDTVK